MTDNALIHETGAVICACGHPAQVHHGVDPVDGCMIVGLPTTPGWCECRLTAPQAEAYDHCCQHPKCPGGSLCCCISEQRQRDCWNQWREEVAGDSRQAFRDGYQAGQNDPAPWLAAPVLPSSGVDEDALARLLCEKNYVSPDGKPTCAACRDKAHEVAAWLKVQGGESRGER